MEAGIRFDRRFITNETKSSKVYVTDDLRVVYIRRGRGTWMIAGHPYAVRSGDLVLLNNRNPRIFAQIDGDNPIEMETLNVCPQYLFEAGFLRLFTGPLGADYPVLSNGNGEIIELFDRIRAEQEGA
ncbi:MAG TPA: AraC family ligand binding domain-containing protein, partial [Clostridia bacterium]|nr:AraC family ligand binding domain-containing protein [Clostridia bacterium]